MLSRAATIIPASRDAPDDAAQIEAAITDRLTARKARTLRARMRFGPSARRKALFLEDGTTSWRRDVMAGATIGGEVSIDTETKPANDRT